MLVFKYFKWPIIYWFNSIIGMLREEFQYHSLHNREGMSPRLNLYNMLLFAGSVLFLIIAILTMIFGNDKSECVQSQTDQIKLYDPEFVESPDIGYVSDPNWWKKAVIYQIYPRSFQDSNGDGTGDLRGIINRLDYLVWLGVKALWLSPIYKSPMADFGYDISNYTDIDPIFGTMQDFRDLVRQMHKRGMYLIMDFVPNHCSSEHPWFKQAISSKTNKYRDYFIWRNGTNGKPPNNWLSFFGNSSWQLDVKSGEFYFHQYLISQPDLNYRNEDVRREMRNVLQFWMGEHVDGFRIDAIRALYEDVNYRDESIVEQCKYNPSCAIPINSRKYLISKYSTDQNETFEELSIWADLMKEYGKKNGKEIFSVTEVYTNPATALRYYDTGISFPFNYELIIYFSSPNRGMSAPPPKYKSMDIKNIIDKWMHAMRLEDWPNWAVGNHDQPRIATRLGGGKYTDAANIMLLLLPGTPTCYYGDEIGMMDVYVTYEQTKDTAGKKWGPVDYVKHSRDPNRTPFQWNQGLNAGFSASQHTWLPVSPMANTTNVQLQINDQKSHLNLFRNLIQLRSMPIFWFTGKNVKTWAPFEDLLVFARTALHHSPPFEAVFVMINIGSSGNSQQISLHDIDENIVGGTVILTSTNVRFTIGMPVQPTTTIELGNAQAIVIQTISNGIMVPLYPLHIPTSGLQKMMLTAGSGIMAILNPQRGAMVATFGETTAQFVIPNIRKRMQTDNEGINVLKDQPRITNTTVDVNALRKLPDDTLGREYARFLDGLDTSPDERPPVRFIDDLDNLYIMQRYRESHDLYHTVLQMPTNMLGEVTVKWFEGLQLGLPMCVIGGIAGAGRLGPMHRQSFKTDLLPWVVEAAQNATFFMNVYWEKHWHRTIQELQTELRVPTPPNVPIKNRPRKN